MADQNKQTAIRRLAPEVNKIIFVRNLPFKTTSEELYDIFGKYGPIKQIRKGTTQETKGTAFVVYEDIFDAKKALESLHGFNVAGRKNAEKATSEEKEMAESKVHTELDQEEAVGRIEQRKEMKS